MTNLTEIVKKLARVKRDLNPIRNSPIVREALADIDNVLIMLEHAATESEKFDEILDKIDTKLKNMQRIIPVK